MGTAGLKRSSRHVILATNLFVLMLCSFAEAVSFFPVAKASTTILYVNPATVTVSPGSDFTVSIRIQNVESPGLQSWQFSMSFNPAMVHATSVTEGSFLKSSGTTLFDAGTIDNNEGTIAGCYCLLFGDPAPTGSGTLANINFHCQGPGDTNLHLHSVILLYPDLQEIPANVQDGHVIQQVTPITVYMNPATTSVTVGSEFTIGIKVQNVVSPGLFGYQFQVSYSSSLLQAVAAGLPSGHFLTPTSPGNIFIPDPGTINQGAGYVSFAAALLGPELGKTGSGTLATISFRCLGAGECDLRVTSIIFVDPNSDEIPYSAQSGHVVQEGTPMTVYVSPQTTRATVGSEFKVSIRIRDVVSPGLFSYQFQVSYSSSLLRAVAAGLPSGHFLTPTSPGNIFIPDPGTINQGAGYVSFAAALLGPELGKTGSGTLATISFRCLGAGECDLRVTSIILVDPDAQQIPSSLIRLQNGHVVQTQSQTGLPPTASFSWANMYDYLNSSVAFIHEFTWFNAGESLDPDGSVSTYTWNFGDGNITQTTDPIIIHAYENVGNCTVVLNVTDNQGLWDTVGVDLRICLLGDLDNDRRVNVIDVALVAKAYGSRSYDSGWDPIADLNNDGWVNVIDVAIVAKEFGETA